MTDQNDNTQKLKTSTRAEPTTLTNNLPLFAHLAGSEDAIERYQMSLIASAQLDRLATALHTALETFDWQQADTSFRELQKAMKAMELHDRHRSTV